MLRKFNQCRKNVMKWLFKHCKANVIVITSRWARHGAHYLGCVWLVILPMTSCLFLILLQYNLKNLQVKPHLKKQKQAWRQIQISPFFLSNPVCIKVYFDLLCLHVRRQNACAYRSHGLVVHMGFIFSPSKVITAVFLVMIVIFFRMSL